MRFSRLVLAVSTAAIFTTSCGPQLKPLTTTTGIPAGTPGVGKKVNLEDGVSVLPPSGLEAFVVSGETAKVKASRVQVEGQSFSEATRLEVLEAGKDTWSMQIQTPTVREVQAGDILLASFFVRCERSRQESGEGQTEFVFELAQEPWAKSVSYPVTAGGVWREIHIPFPAASNYEPGGAQVIFRLGYQPQTIEIADVRVLNFGRDVDVTSLPKTELSYPGREADAAWRTAAQERIAKYRKAPLSVLVHDAAGKPVPGAEVTIQMTAQEFILGTAVNAKTLANAPPFNRTQSGSSATDSESKYVAAIPQYFNTIVLENNLKWKPLAGDWGSAWTFEDASRAIDWARKAGLRTRGHVLVWPSFKHLPTRLKALENDKEKLRAEVRAHVRDLATKMKGRLDHWDVINEPYDNHDLMDILGPEEMVEWFKIAREADPGAKLYLNDYSILSGGPGDNGHRAHFEETIRFLIEKGAPIDGIGMQGHFGSGLTGPEDLLKILDRYAEFKLPILITEYDIVVDDPKLAGDYTRDLYTTLYSHPAVQGIMMWGFWDGKHWKNSAPLFDQTWQLKPSGQSYIDLTQNAWRTNGVLKVDDVGKNTLPAFKGRYHLSVEVEGKKVERDVLLTANGASVTLKLP